MNQTETQTAVAEAPRPAYTEPRDRKGQVTPAAGRDEFVEALDRRMTEGFNLLNGRLDTIQMDVRENRHSLERLQKETQGVRVDAAELLGKSARDWAQLLADQAAAQEAFATKADLENLRGEMNERFGSLQQRLAAVEESVKARSLETSVNARFDAVEQRFVSLETSVNERFVSLETSVNERFVSLETSVNARFVAIENRLTALEASQRELIGMVSKLLAHSEAAVWTRRKILVGVSVAVAAGTAVLVIGTVLRPVLERALAALLGG